MTRGLVVLAGVLTVAASVTAWVATSSSDGWTRYEDRENRFSVSYPSTWTRAQNALTPALETPREILVVGTADLPAGSDVCAQLPENAIEAMGVADVLVSVQEASERLGGRHTIERPEHFDLGQGYEPEATECLPPSHATYEARLIPFRDGSRSFYALVVVGPSASERSRSDALRILDSLDFS